MSISVVVIRSRLRSKSIDDNFANYVKVRSVESQIWRTEWRKLHGGRDCKTLIFHVASCEKKSRSAVRRLWSGAGHRYSSSKDKFPFEKRLFVATRWEIGGSARTVTIKWIESELFLPRGFPSSSLSTRMTAKCRARVAFDPLSMGYFLNPSVVIPVTLNSRIVI